MSDIPAELVLVRDFVNTSDVDGGQDTLTSPQVLYDWFADRGLVRSGDAVGDRELERARELREAIRRVLRGHDGHGDPDRADAHLAALAAELPLVVGLVSGQPALVPAHGGMDGALSAVLAGISTAAARGTWERLKACALDTCQWAFYDESKNRSGRWCSMQICGNRAKTRRYRERQRSGA